MDYEDNIPGFTADQSWTIRRVIREEVCTGVSEGLKKALGPERPACKRVSDLEEVTYGKDGHAGRIGRLEERVESMVWLSRTTLGAAIVAVVAALFQALRGG